LRPLISFQLNYWPISLNYRDIYLIIGAPARRHDRTFNGLPFGHGLQISFQKDYTSIGHDLEAQPSDDNGNVDRFHIELRSYLFGKWMVCFQREKNHSRGVSMWFSACWQSKYDHKPACARPDEDKEQVV